jgi:long-chain acyl-CoA synthetase
MDVSSARVFADVVRAVAAAYPKKSALVSGERSITFGDINARMNRLANGLLARDLRPGDRIAILSRNRAEFIEAYGVAKGGLVALPLNWRLTQDELLYPLTDGEPKAIIAEPEFIQRIEALRPALSFVDCFLTFDQAPAGWQAYKDVLGGADTSEPLSTARPSDLLCLLYTSGTTGRPKGVKLTHGGLLRNARAAADTMLGLREDDVALAVMPLFHVGGMWYHQFPAFARGCTSIVLPEFSPAGVLTALERHGVTYAHLVPTMINALVHDPLIADANLSRMRRVYYAGSSIAPDLLRSVMAAFPHCTFMQGYGSTEGGMITALTGDDHRDALVAPEQAYKPRTCGRPLACEVKVLAPGADGIGEIAVRSDRTMRGYWRNPKATAEAFDGGWLRTGDLGLIDAGGYVTIADRKHDMIVSGGENVYPREVEDALAADPAVLEVAVFGVPHPHWVEQVTAAVVLRPGVAATADELLRRVRTRLAGYKCPKEIFLRDRLPKSGAGKGAQGRTAQAVLTRSGVMPRSLALYRPLASLKKISDLVLRSRA